MTKDILNGVKMAKEEFKILSEIEHILKRPNMYIGGISSEQKECFLNGTWKSVPQVPGLLKIINEILDNSIDEAIRTGFKHANSIKINIDETTVTIEDNGRGIPQEEIQTPQGDTLARPVAAWTRARAGSNFDDEGRTQIGMNGVGSVCTTAFSKKFIGTTSDGANTLTLKCINNGVIENVISKPSSTASGTKVQFWPDLERFGLDVIDEHHIEILLDRVNALAVNFPHIHFKFNGKMVKHATLRRYADMYSEKHVTFDDGRISFFVYGGDKGFRHNSFVNGVHTMNGGQHCDYVIGKLVEYIRPAVEKKHKIDVSPLQVKSHLQLVLFMRDFEDPKFDSQAKERITNKYSDVNNYFAGSSVPWEKLAKKILTTPEIIDPMIDALLAKKLLAEKRAEAAARKKAKKKKAASHLAATGRVADEKIIFFTEGDSAIGNLINVRDPIKHGGFPLRGKVLNVNGMSNLEIMKNKEIENICSIVGLEVGMEPDDLTYGKIGILADADIDGGHIVSLLINVLSHWPRLFHEERVVIVRSPIVVSTNKKTKDVKYFYESDEFTNANLNSDWDNVYKKGLGSLTEDEYSEIINNPRFEVVQLTNDCQDKLEMAFGKDSGPRKEWLMG